MGENEREWERGWVGGPTGEGMAFGTRKMSGAECRRVPPRAAPLWDGVWYKKNECRRVPQSAAKSCASLRHSFFQGIRARERLSKNEEMESRLAGEDPEVRRHQGHAEKVLFRVYIFILNKRINGVGPLGAPRREGG